MPLRYIDAVSTKLTAPLAPGEATITVDPNVVNRLNMLDNGEYIYLSLLGYNVDQYEVVRFTKTAPLTASPAGLVLPVDRDVLNTGQKAFPQGACAEADWSSIQLCEFIKQCIAGE